MKTLGVEATPNITRRFRNEVKLARRITHKNVARVFDLGEHEGNLFLTMECVVGGTLRDLLREGSLPMPRVVGVALDLCSGLSAAHAAGVVHRDLKPTNVLVEATTGRVVMVDFGIAHAVGEESGMTVGALGTPRYMSPEQASAQKVDARTDLYALGVLVLELATGRTPDRARLDADLSEIPAPIASVLRRCVEIDPAKRPSSADEVARALTSLDVAPEPVPPTVRKVRMADEAPDDDDAPTRNVTREPSSRTTSPRTIAVLPFRYRGPPDRDYLGESLAEELVDALTRVRALRVVGTGATSAHRNDRDARVVARELGAIAVVDGTVQLVETSGKPALRLAVRLLDADGAQIHSERFDGGFEDALAIGETIARRIAEHLRFELTVFTQKGDAPPEAIELYLSGRRRARWFAFSSSTTALDELQRAIDLAPTFGPAVAAYALASTRAHFARPGEAWKSEAERAVQRALEIAPDHADTRFAVGNLALQLGDYRGARIAFERALDLAPTFSEVHEYLGQIFLEAGAIELGLRHARTADELDPAHSLGLLSVARHHALLRDWAAHDAIVEEMTRRGHAKAFAVLAMRVRTSIWRRDYAAIKSMYEETGAVAARLTRLQPATFARVMIGEISGEEYEQILAETPQPASARLRTLRAQMSTEVWAHLGDLPRAKRSLLDAADDVLIDVQWLDHAPTLDPLRDSPELAHARRQTMARAGILLAGM